MKKNMGYLDRTLRTILAVIISILYFTGTITGTLGVVLLVVAFMFVLTSLISFCPFYSLLGINTCGNRKK